MKRFLICIAVSVFALNGVWAQTDGTKKKADGAFSHLDASVSLGTTGIGLELSTPLIKDYLNVRAGVDVMPHFEYDMHFGIQVGGKEESKYDDEGNRVETTFDRLAGKLEDWTGITVDDEVVMIGEPTMWNAKVLFDVTPFRNKHWRLTTGFYLGPRKIGKATNALKDAPSLVAVSIYNFMYQRSYNDLPVITTGDFFLYREDLVDYGPMGVKLGTYKGSDDICFIVPDENNIVSARLVTNAFKPYLGFGYGGKLLKNNDRWGVSFDCGLLFWGGTPKIYTDNAVRMTYDSDNNTYDFDSYTEYDEEFEQDVKYMKRSTVDMAHDLENINGKVGDYVDFFKAVKAYPVLNVKFTYNIF